MWKYANIVYMDSFEDFDEFYNLSSKEQAQYLAQWDCGEYHDVTESAPWGTSDTVTKVKIKNVGTYWLSVNFNLEYAALTKMVR